VPCPTELFGLGCVDCFLEEWAQAGPQERRLPPPLRLRVLLTITDEGTSCDTSGTVQRGEGCCTE
jgi:hypothetical protein